MMSVELEVNSSIKKKDTYRIQIVLCCLRWGMVISHLRSSAELIIEAYEKWNRITRSPDHRVR